jgi:hypothetical protein
LLGQGHEAEAGEQVLLALRQQLLDDALPEEGARQPEVVAVDFASGNGREELADGPGIDFSKLYFGPKTFRVNFYPQILDTFSPENNRYKFV